MNIKKMIAMGIATILISKLFGDKDKDKNKNKTKE